MAEKAERERHLKDMEEATKNQVDPIHYDAARFVVYYVALIDGLFTSLNGNNFANTFHISSH
jgi:hypothetical protein